MSEETEQDLVRLIVNLTTDAHESLVNAAQVTGDSQTDTVNRALHLYNRVVAGVMFGDKALALKVWPGDQEPALILLPAGRRVTARTVVVAAVVSWFALLGAVGVAALTLWLLSR